jgi:hypothetical protein
VTTDDPVLRRVYISLDIMFDEEAKWSWDGAQPDNKFVIDYVSVSHPDAVCVLQEFLGVLPAPGEHLHQD